MSDRTLKQKKQAQLREQRRIKEKHEAEQEALRQAQSALDWRKFLAIRFPNHYKSPDA